MSETNTKWVQGLPWGLIPVIIMVTAVTFFTVVEILKEKSPEVFSVNSSGMTASSKNIIAEEVKTIEDVSVMIVPAD